VLGAVFRQTRDIDAALREYETQRCDRVRDLVLKPISGVVLCPASPSSATRPRTRRLNGSISWISIR
jgi:hypothetical protein